MSCILSVNTILVSLGQKTPSQVWVKLHPSRPDTSKYECGSLLGCGGQEMSWPVSWCTLILICKISSDFGKTSKMLINVTIMQGPRSKRYQIPALHYPCYCCMKSSLDDTLEEYSITHPKQNVCKANKFLCSVSQSLDSATTYKAGIWKSTEMFYFLFFSYY